MTGKRRLTARTAENTIPNAGILLCLSMLLIYHNIAIDVFKIEIILANFA
jgi:hypothetical protein